MIKLNEDLPHAFVYPEAVKILNRLKDIQENTIGSIGDSGFHIYLQKTIDYLQELIEDDNDDD